MNEKLSPIILFVYNRLNHTKKTVSALQKNELAKDSLLYVFSDAPKNDEVRESVEKVREYIKTINGFRDIIVAERRNNFGLAKSIISGVTEVINKYNRVIVLEDDLITSPKFLFYMNKLLEIYEKEKKIYSVTGYNHPEGIMKIPKNYKYDIFFNPRACSWSWGTWKDRWMNVDWEIRDFEEFKKDKEMQKKFNAAGDDMTEILFKQMMGKLDSWAIRWGYHHFINNAFCVYPAKSYIDNIGHDNTGVHCGKTKIYTHDSLSNKDDIIFPDEVKLEEELVKRYKKIYKSRPIKKFLKKIKDNLLSKNKNE